MVDKPQDAAADFEARVAARRRARELGDQAAPGVPFNPVVGTVGGVVRGLENTFYGVGELGVEGLIAGGAGLAKLMSDDETDQKIEVERMLLRKGLAEAATDARDVLNLSDTLGLNADEDTTMGLLVEGMAGAIAPGLGIAKAVPALGRALTAGTAIKRMAASAGTFGVGEGLSYTSTRSAEEQALVSNLLAESGWAPEFLAISADSDPLLNRARAAFEGVVIGLIADGGIESAKAYLKMRKLKGDPTPTTPDEVAALPDAEKHLRNNAMTVPPKPEVGPALDGEIMPDIRGRAAPRSSAGETIDGTATQVPPAAGLLPPPAAAAPDQSIGDIAARLTGQAPAPKALPAPRADAPPPKADAPAPAPKPAAASEPAAPAPAAAPAAQTPSVASSGRNKAGQYVIYDDGTLVFKKNGQRTYGGKLDPNTGEFKGTWQDMLADDAALAAGKISSGGDLFSRQFDQKSGSVQKRAIPQSIYREMQNLVPEIRAKMKAAPAQAKAPEPAAAPKAKPVVEEPNAYVATDKDGMSAGSVARIIDKKAGRGIIEVDGAARGEPNAKTQDFFVGDGQVYRIFTRNGAETILEGSANGFGSVKGLKKIESAHGKMKAMSEIMRMRQEAEGLLSKADAKKAAAKTNAAPAPKKARETVQEAAPKWRFAADAAEWMERNAADKSYRRLANRLKNVVQDASVRTYKAGDKVAKELADLADGRILGGYWTRRRAGQTDAAIVYRSDTMSEEVVMHELIHSAADDLLEQGAKAAKGSAAREAYEAVDDLFKEVAAAVRKMAKKDKSLLDTTTVRGARFAAATNDIKEFVSYGLSSKEFQSLLKGIKSAPGTPTLWSRFVSAMRQALGLGVEDTSALGRLMEVTDDLLDQPHMVLHKAMDVERVMKEGGEVTVKDAKSLIENITRAAPEDRGYIVGISAMAGGFADEAAPTVGGRAAAEGWVRRTFRDPKDAQVLMDIGDAVVGAFKKSIAALYGSVAHPISTFQGAVKFASSVKQWLLTHENSFLYTIVGNMLSRERAARFALKAANKVLAEAERIGDVTAAKAARAEIVKQQAWAKFIRSVRNKLNHQQRRFGDDVAMKTLKELNSELFAEMDAILRPIRKRLDDHDGATHSKIFTVIQQMGDRNLAGYKALTTAEKRLVDDINDWFEAWEKRARPVLEESRMSYLRAVAAHGRTAQREAARKELAEIAKGKKLDVMGNQSKQFDGELDTYGRPLKGGYMPRVLDIGKFRPDQSYDDFEKAAYNMFVDERMADWDKRIMSAFEKAAVKAGREFDADIARSTKAYRDKEAAFRKKTERLAKEDAAEFRSKVENDHGGIVIRVGTPLRFQDMKETSRLARRRLPSNAHEYLGRWYDDQDLVSSMRFYSNTMSNEVAFKTMFKDGWFIEQDAVLRGLGVSSKEIQMVFDEILTAGARNPALGGGHRARAIVGLLSAFQVIAFLPRTFMTALTEPLTAIAQNIKLTGKVGLKDVLSDLGHSYKAAWRSMDLDPNMRREWLESQGIIPEDMYMAVAAMHQGDIAMSKWVGQTTDFFLRKTLQTGQLRAHRIFAATRAARSLKLMANNANKITDDGLLALGIPKAKHAEFRDFVKKLEMDPRTDGVFPTDASLARNPEMAGFYKDAIRRVVNDSNLMTDAASKPRWASHILLRPVYGLLSYAFAFHRNVFAPLGTRAFDAARLYKAGELDGRTAFAVASPAIFLMTMAPLMQGVISEARGAMMGPDSKGRNRMEGMRQDELFGIQGLGWGALIAMRAGLVPPQLDTAFNLTTGLRYERDLATGLMGPSIGGLLGSGQKVLKGVTTGNAKMAADGVWDGVLAPGINAGLAAMPFGRMTGIAQGAAIQAVAMPQTNKAWNEGIASVFPE